MDQIPSELLRASRALAAHVLRATVPLLVNHEGESKIVGTATLLRVDDARLLLTASHVAKLQTEEGHRLIVPYEDGVGTTFGKELVYAVNDDIHDIAVAKLDSDVVARVEAGNWEFVSMANVRDVSAKTLPDGAFAVYGFPSEGAARIGGRVKPIPHVLGCEPYRGPTDDLPSSHDAGVHLLFESTFHGLVREDTGEPASFPDPRGISGGSVWRLRADAADPVAMSEFVGVQSSLFRNPVRLKVVAWPVIRRFIAEAWPELKAALDIVIARR